MINFDNFNIGPVQLEDYWGLCNFVVSNEDRLKRYLPKTMAQNQTPTLSKAFVQQKVKQANSKELFLYIVRENKIYGIAGLIYLKNIDWKRKQGEFAYCIGYQHENKGITSKAVGTLSDYAFSELGLRTLQIIVHKSNVSSVKVAKNNGFLWKRTLKNEFTPPNGQAMDMELYELLYEG